MTSILTEEQSWESSYMHGGEGCGGKQASCSWNSLFHFRNILKPTAVLFIGLKQRPEATWSIWKYREEKCNFLNYIYNLAEIWANALQMQRNATGWLNIPVGESLIFYIFIGPEEEQQTLALVIQVQILCYFWRVTFELGKDWNQCSLLLNSSIKLTIQYIYTDFFHCMAVAFSIIFSYHMGHHLTPVTVILC